MKLIEVITDLIWSSNTEDFLFLQRENSYFNYKLRLLLETNNSLLKNKNIKDINIPKDNYKRIDKIKLASFKEGDNKKLKNKFYPNYRLFHLVDLIEDKGIENKDIISKYNQLKEYYSELNDFDVDLSELNKNILKLDYSDNLNKFNNIKNKIEELNNNKLVNKNESIKVKVDLLMENINKINKRNLIFKSNELNKMNNIINNLSIIL